MAERLERLKQLLAELEQELANVGSVDPSTAELLSRVQGEIDGAIEKSEPETLNESGLVKQLQTQMEAFESAHPALTNLISQFTNALGQLGI